MLDVNQIEYVQLKGEQITDEFYQLTNGIGGGLMSVWMRDNRADMGAVAVQYKGQFIGWAAYLKEEECFYSLGTFIAQEYRECGLGRMVLTLLVEVIRAENTLAWCKSGCSLFHAFNDTYKRIVTDGGLRHAHIFDSNEQIKVAA